MSVTSPPPVGCFADVADDDLAIVIHRAAVAHYRACEENLYDEYEESELAGDASLPESPAVAPYCGCEDCIVREILSSAWSGLQELVARGMAAPA